MKVFTNGCFDLLHAGHLSLLEYCSTLGTLTVGLNSDDSVRYLKGPSRPILSQEERKYALECCRFVDRVVIFNEPTPINLIKELAPDIIVKGGDYSGGQVVGEEFARVSFFEFTWPTSTTKIIERINSGRH